MLMIMPSIFVTSLVKTDHNTGTNFFKFNSSNSDSFAYLSDDTSNIVLVMALTSHTFKRFRTEKEVWRKWVNNN